MCMRWTYIDPTTAFSIQYSFMPVLMAIFGGTGHLYAPMRARPSSPSSKSC